MYNSDTVYSTTTFRPVSPSPRTVDLLPAPTTPSPQRTRKLETPFHFDGGLFSDIRSQEGKLLSKVTVDRVHSASRHDVTDSPTIHQRVGTHENTDYVDNILKTETITNEDVIKIKFTPVRQELDVPRLLTPSQFAQQPIEYIKDDFEDLQSYKIVNSVNKENKFGSEKFIEREKSADSFAALELPQRAHSPLASLAISEQMTKIDEYLQKSLDVCSSTDGNSLKTVGSTTSEGEVRENETLQNISSIEDKSYYQSDVSAKTESSYRSKEEWRNGKQTTVLERESNPSVDYGGRKKSKTDGVQARNNGVLSAIYNMPMHYHAVILCFILIVYNLIYQYIKKNCHGGTK